MFLLTDFNEKEESMSTQKFPLRTLLTITTDRLLTERKGSKDNGISDLYEILEFLTGESPFTHSLGRFAEECKPYLLAKYPELENVHLDRLDSMSGSDSYQNVQARLELCTEEWGMKEEYELEPIPKKAHKAIHPVEELQSMMSDSEVIVVTTKSD